MDYGKSFTYIFEDEKWISKFLVGVVISLVPIVNFAAYGYMIQVLKNVRDGLEEPLPEWDDFGKLFLDGIKFLAGYLVYVIPVIVISIAMIPVAIAADVGGITEDAVVLVMLCLYCIMFLFILVPAFLYPALYIQYARDDQISDMFKFSEMWEMIKADTSNYIIVLLMVYFVLGFIASFGMVICFVGIFFTVWWSQLAAAHMIGQLAQPKEKPATF
jgi:hypothetical protein